MSLLGERRELCCDGSDRIEVTRDERGNPLEETQYIGAILPFGHCSTEACPPEATVEMTEEQRAEIEAEMARMFAPGTAMSKHVHRYDEEGRLVESKLTISLKGRSLSSS